ncbi:hypothetical protein HELRODRAFT_183627 [Helobdella robusta]|uniref:Ig-like domain-containing protein n=1 Tax=Helobdella robusta TaxID=6412 RepID=T1FJY5_HELRO|nr:hypothetical protein HELRODRAFT_183627 [Helobdella robusta]ESO10406.1 hypothetical protein HELRODRAFT_183627 [Helobdella robusta]
MMLVVLGDLAVEYKEHYVRKGEAWSVECQLTERENQSNEIDQAWFFELTDENNNYNNYTNQNILDIKDSVLQVSFNHGEPPNLKLVITKIDYNHVGFYYCRTNKKTTTNELILIISSKIELAKAEDESDGIKLDMQVTYKRYERRNDQNCPVFSCDLKPLRSSSCRSRQGREICSVQNFYGQNERHPRTCEIGFNNFDHVILDKKKFSRWFFIELKTL